MSGIGRQYDIVLLGATGYTGKLAASYIAKNLHTDLKWAVAGRSARKLEAVATTCNELNPDRIPPAIEVCDLNDVELGDLARKTTVLITTVGPYAIYGEYAFKACAENGTHYLDCTGETPFLHKMIQKYETAAKTSGAIMISHCGIESVLPDLLAWSLVSLIRNKLSAPTGSIVLSCHDLVSGISGGTLLSAITMLDTFSQRELDAASRPFALSPIPGPTRKSTASWYTKIFGIRTVVPELGILTTSIQARSDEPIVQRSWGVLGGAKFYGPNFYFEQYMRANSYIRGIAIHFAFGLASLLFMLSPFRRLLKRFIVAPGDGPTEEETVGNRAEWRAIATPDTEAPNTPKAYARAYWGHGMYLLTGMLLAEGAVTILRDDTVARKLGGGILTPATLGQPFLDRIIKAGLKFETKLLDH